MYQLWRDCLKRNKHKVALRHSWMRNNQIRFVDDGLIIKKNININQSFHPFANAQPSHFQLYAKNSLNKCVGRKVGFHREGLIDKCGLLGVAPRCRFVKIRQGEDISDLSFDKLIGNAEVFFSISKITARV